MVEEVRGAFDQVIKRQDWLEDDMKDVCSDKVTALKCFISLGKLKFLF